MVRRRAGELWIKECGVPQCPQDGKRQHYHQLNPNSQAAKSIEMTVRRALDLIDIFENEVIDDDLSTVSPSKWRKIYGQGWYLFPEMENMVELHRRYQTGELQREVLELWGNLPEDTRKKEKKRVDRIRKATTS